MMIPASALTIRAWLDVESGQWIAYAAGQATHGDSLADVLADIPRLIMDVAEAEALMRIQAVRP